MDSEIKKITLEIEEKAAQNVGGIDSLINSLSKLNNSVSSSSGKLKSLSGSFDTLNKSITSVNKLNFTGLQTSLNSLTNSINKLNNASFGNSIGDQLKSVSSGVNSVKNSFTKLEQIAPTLNKMDISGFTSNLRELGKLSSYAKSFTELKQGAQDFNKALTSMNKASEKLPDIIAKINELDLTKFTQQVEELSKSLAEFSKAISTTETSVSGFSKTVNTLPTVVNKTSKAVVNANNKIGTKGFFGGANMLANIYMLQQLGRAFAYPIGKANDFIETLNLFDVVMGESGRQAAVFINALETIGVDQEQAMRFQSSFYDIAKSMGMVTNNAYTLSEQFTKLTYDYASLYNMNVEEAFFKLQSAITGELEPIRRLGKDISETRLQQVAWDLGIQQSVRTMDQASKAELRFIAVMQQSGAAMNDMERTINNPANALRVLRAQFVSLAREIGNLFIPMVSAVLPYLIAVVKVLRDIVAAIAGLFGVKLMTIEFSGIDTSVGSAAAGADDLADSTGTASDNLGSAADNAKKLKSYMLGIDELNVIDPNQGSSGGSGGSGGGAGGGIGGGSGLGLDLSDFGYAKVLDDVKSKADAIYEAFARWKPLLIALAALMAVVFAINKIADFIKYLQMTNANAKLIADTFKKIGQLSFFQTLSNAMKTVMNSAKLLGASILANVLPSLKSFGESALSVSKSALSSLVAAINKVGMAMLGVSTTSTATFVAGMATIIAVAAAVAATVALIAYGMKNDFDAEDYKNLFDDIATKIGEFISEVASKAGELFKAIGEVLAEVVPAIIAALPSLTVGFTAFLTQSLPEILQAVLNILGPIGQAIAEFLPELLTTIAALIGGIILFIAEHAAEIIDGIRRTFGPIANSILEALPQILSSLAKIIANVVSGIIKALPDILVALGKIAVGVLGWIGELIIDIMKALPELIPKVIDWIAGIFAELLPQLGILLLDLIKWLGDLIIEIMKKLPELIPKLITWIGEIFGNIAESLGLLLSDIIEWVGELIVDIIEKLPELIPKMIKWIGTIFGSISSSLGNLLKKVIGWVGELIIKIMKELPKLITKVIQWIGEIPGKLLDAIVELGSKLMNLIKEKVINPIKNAIKSFFDDPLGSIGSAVGTVVGKITGKTSARTQSITPSVTAFAEGGFIPANSRFVPPENLWTAGEAGREVIGTFRSRPTVMPLENTGFVQAMYQAVYDATRSAYSENEMNIYVQPKVQLDSKDIAQGQESYKYSSGVGLVKKMV